MALYIGIKNLIGKGAAWLRSKWTTILTQLAAAFRFRLAGGSDNALLPGSNGRAVFKKIYGSTVKWNQIRIGILIENTWSKVSNADGSFTITALSDNQRLSVYLSYNLNLMKQGHKYLFSIGNKNLGNLRFKNEDSSNTAVSEMGRLIYELDSTLTQQNRLRFFELTYTRMQGFSVTIMPMIIDLTAMFGAGNEPSTVEEFEAWLALNLGTQDYYPYDEGSLVSFKGQGVKVTGWNKFHVVNGSGVADVKKDVKYYVAGPFGSLHYSDGTAISVASDRTFTAIKDDTITFGSVSNSIVLNIYTGTAKDGTYEPYHEEVVDLSGAYINVWDEMWVRGGYDNQTGEPNNYTNGIRNINRIPVVPGKEYYFKAPSECWLYYYDEQGYRPNDSGGTVGNTHKFTVPAGCTYLNFRCGYNANPVITYNHDICINVSNADINGTYYPHALQSAGSVTDEVTATELTKKIGIRAYQSGDESDPTVITDGTTTYYPLVTPIVIPHDTPMQYAVDKYSTEELLVPASVAGEPTSTAIVADIEYQAK